MDRSLFLILASVLSLYGLDAYAACPVNDTDTAVRGKVASVADGDTIRVTVGSKNFPIRFLSIDTPETHYQGQTQGRWGDLAAQRLAQLLPIGTAVEVRLDIEKCDSYGRVLGHVFKGSELVNETMVREGLAVTYCIYPNIEYCTRLAPLTMAAMDAKRGMFSDPTVELPYDFRRRVSGRPYEKWVGSLRTMAVLEPEKQNLIKVWDRIFFMSQEDVEPPFYIARIRAE